VRILAEARGQWHDTLAKRRVIWARKQAAGDTGEEAAGSAMEEDVMEAPPDLHPTCPEEEAAPLLPVGHSLGLVHHPLLTGLPYPIGMAWPPPPAAWESAPVDAAGKKRKAGGLQREGTEVIPYQ